MKNTGNKTGAFSWEKWAGKISAAIDICDAADNSTAMNAQEKQGRGRPRNIVPKVVQNLYISRASRDWLEKKAGGKHISLWMENWIQKQIKAEERKKKCQG